MTINDSRLRRVLAQQPDGGLSHSLDKGQIFRQRTKNKSSDKGQIFGQRTNLRQRTKVDDTETGFSITDDRN